MFTLWHQISLFQMFSSCVKLNLLIQSQNRYFLNHWPFSQLAKFLLKIRKARLKVKFHLFMCELWICSLDLRRHHAQQSKSLIGGWTWRINKRLKSSRLTWALKINLGFWALPMETMTEAIRFYDVPKNKTLMISRYMNNVWILNQLCGSIDLRHVRQEKSKMFDWVTIKREKFRFF